MAGPSRLSVSNLPGINADEQAATSLPARGAEYAASLRARLFNHDSRVMALVHSWDFWYEKPKQNSNAASTTTSSTTNGNAQSSSGNETKTSNTATSQAAEQANTIETTPLQEQTSQYHPNLENLFSISDVRKFWEVFNNLDITRLPYRESVHLFHLGIQPTWEHPRNARGGSLCFKVPRALALEFWKEICVMAIGEQLQSAVATPERESFRDEICGVSCSNRLQVFVVQVWNRDAGNEGGIEKLKGVVLEGLTEGLRPKEGSGQWPCYRRHADHEAFQGQSKRT